MLRKINKDKYIAGRVSNDAQARNEKRTRGRIRCVTLTCDLGLVRDLSATGFLVHSAKRPKAKVGDTVRLTLSTHNEHAVVRATCQWLRVDERCEFDSGWHLVDVDPHTRQRLLEFASLAQARDTLSRGWSPMEWWKKAS